MKKVRNLPRIEFKTSYYLQSKILACPYNRENLINFLDALEEKFNLHSDDVLLGIESLTKTKWNIKVIPVWLFEGWYPSISSPLMLNTHDYDLDFVFFNLVHELVHVNIMNIKIEDDDGNWNHKLLETIVNLTTIHVLKNIYSEDKLKELALMAEFNGFYEYVWRDVWKFIDKDVKVSELLK